MNDAHQIANAQAFFVVVRMRIVFVFLLLTNICDLIQTSAMQTWHDRTMALKRRHPAAATATATACMQSRIMRHATCGHLYSAHTHADIFI